jgi:serine protease Do
MWRLIFLILFVLLTITAVVWLTGVESLLTGTRTHSVLRVTEEPLKSAAGSRLLGTNVESIRSQANKAQAVAAALVPSMVAIKAKASAKDAPLRKLVDKMAAYGLRPNAAGGGVFIDREGLILTNFSTLLDGHVWRVYTADGREHDAELVGLDEVADLALLRIPKASTLPVRWAGSPPNFAETLLLLGLNPQDGPRALDAMASSGVLEYLPMDTAASYRHYLLDEDLLASHPGWLLLNLDGLAVGLVAHLEKDSHTRNAVAITPDSLAMVIEQLKHAPLPPRHYLGVDSEELPPPSHGLRVTRVKEHSPLADAGLKIGDIMQLFGGAALTTRPQLCQTAEAMAIGAKVPLTVLRGQQTLTLHVILREHPTGLRHLTQQWIDQVAKERKKNPVFSY